MKLKDGGWVRQGKEIQSTLSMMSNEYGIELYTQH